MSELPAAMTTASRRGRGLAPIVVAALGVAAAPACKLNQQGVPPPLDRIAFPASALVDPGGHWLYVANSNSDLRYNSGTLVAVDLDAVAVDRFGAAHATATGPVADGPRSWSVCKGADRVRIDADEDPCCWDYLDHQILNCDDRLYIPPSSTVEIGSFASGMAFQHFTEPSCANKDMATVTAAPADRHDCNAHCPGDTQTGRLFIGVRGNSTITYVDVDPFGASDVSPLGVDKVVKPRPLFSCPDSMDHPVQGVCQVATMPGPSSPGAPAEAPIHVPDEPYALALDEQQDLLYVGNLRGDTSHPMTGGISLFDVKRPAAADAKHPTPANVPAFLGASASFFNPDVTGQFGITSLTKRNGKVYACSRYGTNAVDIIPSLDGTCDQGTRPGSEPIALFAGSDVFTTPLVGLEIRGIQFLPEGNRAFVLQRTPPALVSFDISTDPHHFGNFSSEVLETCSGPTFLQSYDAGEGMRLFVTCFDAGQIYVVDPYVPRVISVLNAGRGPAGLVFPETLRTDRPERLAYVVGFSANDISVLDLTPGSPTQYHLVQRIGFPSVNPR
jgi:hypothetical protein